MEKGSVMFCSYVVVQPLTFAARLMAKTLFDQGFSGSDKSPIHMPASGLFVHVGSYIAWLGRPPVFGMMPRIGCLASPAYLQPTSFENQAPLLLPLANTRFWSKQIWPARRSHRFS